MEYWFESDSGYMKRSDIKYVLLALDTNGSIMDYECYREKITDGDKMKFELAMHKKHGKELSAIIEAEKDVVDVLRSLLVDEQAEENLQD